MAHKAVDVSLPENKEALASMQQLSGKKELPQVFVRGLFRGASVGSAGWMCEEQEEERRGQRGNG